MKTLVVVRHAKSSWDNPNLRDFDRPLNSRGARDAPEMGRRLLKLALIPDLMLSSPANRALTTCKVIANQLGYRQEDIQTNDDLYHAQPETMLHIIGLIPDHVNIAYIFGHNPGLTEFVSELTDELIDNIPTTGVAVCELTVDQWRDVEFGCGRLKHFDYPKKNH